MSEPTPLKSPREIAIDIWLEYQERRNDYRLTAVDLSDYFEKAVTQAIQSECLDRQQLQGEIDRLREWINDVGSELPGDSKQYRNDAISAIRGYKTQLSAQTVTIGKLREALLYMKLAAGMFEDFSHGDADVKLCRSQYAHALTLYKETFLSTEHGEGKG